MKSLKQSLAAAAGLSALALALAIPSLSPSIANAQVATPLPMHHRGEHGSAKNLRNVRRHLTHMIASLQHDAHDYGGNRVKAIADLQTARADIEAAINYDASHGH